MTRKTNHAKNQKTCVAGRGNLVQRSRVGGGRTLGVFVE